MQRKTTILSLVAGVLFGIGLVPASAQKQTLRMAYWAGPAHQMVQRPRRLGSKRSRRRPAAISPLWSTRRRWRNRRVNTI